MRFKDYIDNRHGEEANQVERQSMNDRFLRDAIDGYDAVNEDLMPNINKLEKRFDIPQKRISSRNWRWVAVAVLLIFLIGTPFVFRQPQRRNLTNISSSDLPKQQKQTAAPLPKKDTLLVADNKTMKAPEKITDASSVEKTEITEAYENRNLPIDGQAIDSDSAGTDLNSLPHDIKRTLGNSLQEKSGIPTLHKRTDEMTVKGRIVDETGNPIPGVTVSLKNSHLGTVTNTDGNFRFSVPVKTQETLVASYIGMHDKQIPMKPYLGDITMRTDKTTLNETIVVDYGTKEKTATTKSASTIPKFTEKDFTTYFTRNYDKKICAGQYITIIVEFYINANGHPANIHIIKNSCPGLETEIRRLLLGSPEWSETNRKVRLEMKL